MTKEDKLKNLYVKRDVSWMYFNHRILQEAKKEYVRNYLLSDLSQKDFVEQHGISKSAIYNWLKNLKSI